MWKHMHFGLGNMPTHFQKTVLMVGYQGNNWSVVYTDDMLKKGNSHDVVWQQMQLVLEQLVFAGFMVNVKKIDCYSLR